MSRKSRDKERKGKSKGKEVEIDETDIPDVFIERVETVDEEVCCHCHRQTKHQCSRCNLEYFCSSECLTNGWKSHKPICEFILNPPSVALGNYSEPVVVLVNFRAKQIFEFVFRELLGQLRARSKFLKATTPERLKEILVEEKPTVILIADDTLMYCKYNGVRRKFMEFAKAGGTVVFCCWFAHHCDRRFMARMFQNEWDLSWKKPVETEKKFCLNPYRWTKLHAIDELPQKLQMRGFYLRGAMKEDAVYVTSGERRANQSWWVHDHGRSAVLFTPTGLGWVGYVGDDEVAPGLSQIVCAMCGLLDE